MDVGNSYEDLLFALSLEEERYLRHDDPFPDTPEEVVEFPAAFGEVREEGVGQFERTDFEVCFHGTFDYVDEGDDAYCKLIWRRMEIWTNSRPRNGAAPTIAIPEWSRAGIMPV